MLSDQINESLKRIALSNNISEYDVSVDKGSSSGDGYLSIIKSVTLKDKTGKTEINLIIKIAPSAPSGESIPSKQFQREIYFYKNILPKFAELVNDFSSGDLLNAYINCYETSLETGKEYLIFENIKLQGYKLWATEEPLSQQLVTLVCREFGKFHALSFALQAKKPAAFKKIVNEVKLPAIDLNPDGLCKKILKEIYENASRALGEGSDRMAAYKRVLQQDKFNLFKLHEHISLDEFMAVLHGDSWLNNMLFQYQPNAQPTDLKLLDFQLVFAGPSTVDLSCFLFICCEKKLLVDLNKYLDVYYDAVTDTLKKLHCDPGTAFPRKVFDKQWREFSPFGLMSATLFMKMMLFNKEEKIKMEKNIADPENSFFIQDIERQPEYNKRMQDLATK